MTKREGLHRLQPASRKAKARSTFQSSHGPTLMVAIGVIALFLIVFSALNKFEFGRFD